MVAPPVHVTVMPVYLPSAEPAGSRAKLVFSQRVILPVIVPPDKGKPVAVVRIFTPSTAKTPADTRERVVSVAPPAPSSTVVNEGAVREESIAVPQTVGIFVLSISVNQPLVTRVAVAPIVVTKRLAHFLSVVPKSSVLSVSETREVLIATLARFDRAVLAHAAGISDVRAIVPVVAGAVSTTPVPATALGWIVTSPEVFP